MRPRPVLTDPDVIRARAGEGMLVRFHEDGPIVDRSSHAVVDEDAAARVLTEEPRTGEATFYVPKS
jgi:hypothetical protein